MSAAIVSRLKGKELRAAQLDAEGETAEAIASQVGVTSRTIERWRERPDFANHVGRLRVEIAAALKAEGIRRRENRLASYQDTFDRLMMIVEDRADDAQLSGHYYNVPGYRSGLMVADVKFGGDGDRVTVYKVDTGLVSALLAVQKQIAQDTGQWSEKDESATLHGKKTSIINTVYVGVPRPDFTQIAVQQVVEIDE